MISKKWTDAEIAAAGEYLKRRSRHDIENRREPGKAVPEFTGTSDEFNDYLDGVLTKTGRERLLNALRVRRKLSTAAITPTDMALALVSERLKHADGDALRFELDAIVPQWRELLPAAVTIEGDGHLQGDLPLAAKGSVADQWFDLCSELKKNSQGVREGHVTRFAGDLDVEIQIVKPEPAAEGKTKKCRCCNQDMPASSAAPWCKKCQAAVNEK